MGVLATNLATRPFYNERAVHLVLAALGLLAVSVLALGVGQLIELSRVNGALTQEAAAAEREAAAISSRAATLERGMPADAMASLGEATEEAGRLLQQRVFSWTAFFNVIEETLPAGVMLAAVRPDVETDGVSIDLAVIARGLEDIDEFIGSLESTGVFADVLARQEELTDDGMYRAQVRGRLVRADGGAGPARVAPAGNP